MFPYSPHTSSFLFTGGVRQGGEGTGGFCSPRVKWGLSGQCSVSIVGKGEAMLDESQMTVAGANQCRYPTEFDLEKALFT